MLQHHYLHILQQITANALPVELLLEALIGIVDAQLFKTVLLEALKAIDVQDAERGFGLLLAC